MFGRSFCALLRGFLISFTWVSALVLLTWSSAFVLLTASGCGGECRYDSDCAGDKLCREGVCTTHLTGDPCKSDTDCSPGKKCLNTICVTPQCQEGIRLPCYDGDPMTSGVGLCQAGIKHCLHGRWSRCEGQITPSSELCDQLDNDCNGKVDDDPSCSTTCSDKQQRACYTGPATTRSQGICRAGTETCQGNKWGACLGQVLPAPKEVCHDGLDNNCDGQVDEGCGPCQNGQTRPCYSGVSNTRAQGECKDGVQTCQNGNWGPCAGEVLPAAEVCDQKDNDCNGKIDDNPNCQGACQPGQTRACYDGPPGTKGTGTCKGGTQTCQNGQWTACNGQVKPIGERCGDQLDNNCNGQVDEGCGVCTNGARQVCFSGRQGCSKNPDGTYNCVSPCRSGIRTCQNGQWTSCVNERLPLPRETCHNNIDDDCNGQIDDGCGACTSGQTQPCYTGPASTKGVGACKPGMQTCQGTNWGPCIGEVKPSNEQCHDGLDNNCDGQVDENCATKLHKTCQTNNDCDPGQICLNAGTQGFCFQDCSTNSTVCLKNRDGRTTCMPVSTTPTGQILSICVKALGPGSACMPTQSLMCQSGYACLGGTCKAVKQVGIGQVCDANTNPPKLCGVDALCVGFGTGYDSICLKICDPTNAASCGAGYECVKLQAGGGACLRVNCTSDAECGNQLQCIMNTGLNKKICAPLPKPGPVAFGGVCDINNMPAQGCQRGLFCLYQSGSTKGHCSQLCTGSGQGNCPSVSPGITRCVQIDPNSSNKACLIYCNGTCPAGLRCQSVSGVMLCFP